jgi:hypothetical protein
MIVPESATLHALDEIHEKLLFHRAGKVQARIKKPALEASSNATQTPVLCCCSVSSLSTTLIRLPGWDVWDEIRDIYPISRCS